MTESRTFQTWNEFQLNFKVWLSSHFVTPSIPERVVIMSFTNCSTFLLVVLVGVLVQASVSYRLPANTIFDRTTLARRRQLSQSSSSSDPDFANFNPFDKSSKPAFTAPINLRETTMKELTNQLLDKVDDPPAMQGLLEDFRDFLLEPLEDEDGVTHPNQSRAERFASYRANLNGRIEQSKHPSVRTILEAMRDFVMECE